MQSLSKKRLRRRRAAHTVLCLSFAAVAAAPAAAFTVSSPLGVRRQNTAGQQSQHRTARHGIVAPNGRQALSHTVLSASAVPNIAVSLDKPLLTDAGTLIPYEKTSRFMGGGAVLRWFSSLFSTRPTTIQVAAVALVGALLMAVLIKSSGASSVRTLFGIANGHVQRFVQERTVLAPTAAVGEPVTFSTDNDGYGLCTLKSKKPLGKTSYIQYEFALPRSDDVLSLELGQELELSCLDNQGAVADGFFYLYQPVATAPLGSFSILVPNAKSSKDLSKQLGAENANFARVLKQDVKVGDEVAIRPGPHKLDYRGQFLPVTDMVYVCFGTGIVPVLEQVRAVLPNGSSSVTSVTVVWINNETNDFDVNAEILEKEYFKYSSKMAASCIVENVAKLSSMADSVEINSSIPDFRPGTMAVLSGPAPLVKRAREYLEDRGYPADTLCDL